MASTERDLAQLVNPLHCLRIQFLHWYNQPMNLNIVEINKLRVCNCVAVVCQVAHLKDKKQVRLK